MRDILLGSTPVWLPAHLTASSIVCTHFRVPTATIGSTHGTSAERSIKQGNDVMIFSVMTTAVCQASTAATGRANPARVFLVAALSAVFVLADLLPACANSPAVELQGRGVQIYICELVSGVMTWRLKGPEAALLDAAGSEVGDHFAGPSWRAKDGSTVVGEPLIASRSPIEGSIPWLVLRAKSHTGSGIFSSVEYIVRSHTDGGVAPNVGCDQTNVGTETRVGYSAVYVFFTN
jgi:Protein of unknown function (DUF3455)